MKNLILNPESKSVIQEYIRKSHLVPYEKQLLNEMLQAVKQADQAKLNWFNSFGKDLRHMTVNVYPAVLGHFDTTNFKQSVIQLTLSAIKQAQVDSVQLALF